MDDCQYRRSGKLKARSGKCVVLCIQHRYNLKARADVLKRRVTKPRGYPDRRGMGAQSDFIAEQFVPNAQYKAQQMAMIQRLTEAGVNPEQLERMFLVPTEMLSDEKQKDEEPKDR
jgi:hypothetical protein